MLLQRKNPKEILKECGFAFWEGKGDSYSFNKYITSSYLVPGTQQDEKIRK